MFLKMLFYVCWCCWCVLLLLRLACFALVFERCLLCCFVEWFVVFSLVLFACVVSVAVCLCVVCFDLLFY